MTHFLHGSKAKALVRLGAILPGLFLGCMSSAMADPGFPDTFVGTWQGSGTLTHQDGSAERIRCQAKYMAPDRRSLRQDLDCQSDSTRFDLRTEVHSNGGRLTGEWIETSRNARGNLVGTADRDTIRAQVTGPGFSAGVGIAARGNRQTVNISSRGADITNLRMTLSKRR